MKGCLWVFFASLNLATTAVLAQEEPQLPNIDGYVAKQAPKPPLTQRVSQRLRFLSGTYITAKAGYSFINVNDIENTTPASSGFTPPAPHQESATDAVLNYGVAVGYTIRPYGGIFSRIEIEYMHRGNFNYDISPIVNASIPIPPSLTTLSSNLTNQTLLFNIYDDINFDAPLVPYVKAGVGLSRNTVDLQANYLGTVTSNSITNTGLAADAGLGLRYIINSHLAIDLGYEFDWLGGAAEWNINAPVAAQNVNLQSKSIYSNSVNLGITLQA